MMRCSVLAILAMSLVAFRMALLLSVAFVMISGVAGAMPARAVYSLGFLLGARRHRVARNVHGVVVYVVWPTGKTAS